MHEQNVAAVNAGQTYVVSYRWEVLQQWWKRMLGYHQTSVRCQRGHCCDRRTNATRQHHTRYQLHTLSGESMLEPQAGTIVVLGPPPGGIPGEPRGS